MCSQPVKQKSDWDRESCPAHEVIGEIGYEVFFESYILWAEDEFEANLELIPIFPFCGANLKGDPVIWNIYGLIASYKTPGRYELITCSCGYADCADIKDGVYVSHPDNTTIVWEMDIVSFRSVLKQIDTPTGFIRIIFTCAEYERGIRAMLKQMEAIAKAPMSPETFTPLTDMKGVHNLPPDAKIVVEDFAPDNDAINDFLEKYGNLQWVRSPMFEEGTKIEIGVWGFNLLTVNGVVSRCWLPHYFTHWSVRNAYNNWMATLRSYYEYDPITKVTIAEKSRFILDDKCTAEDCHLAGHRFAEEFARSLAEGYTTSDVTVRYVERTVEGP